jgi:1-acyl-sn-glycerol-3-phosphate acyltransferase
MRKNYLWYQFFRYIIVRPALRLFYSDITVAGRKNIPGDKPILFVGNHQNSFLDALHLVTNTKLFIHFLTRAEAFQNPVLARFYRSINMLPVYRVRDGFSAVKKNKKIFNECFERLNQGNDAVLVFAEANHDPRRRVRPFSKGFTRIAFGAEEHFDWDLDLQVIPVGISYGGHKKSRTPVRVEFGECIPVSDFKEQYEEDDREAANQLKKVTSEGLKKVTMHVRNLNHYPLYHLLLDDLETDRKALLDPQIVNSRVAEIEPHVDDELVDKAERLLDKADTYEVELHDFVDPPRFGTKDVLLSPLYLFSLFNNALPYQVVRWMTNNYIEDHVFDASVKFLVGILLPVYYLIISAVLRIIGIELPVIGGYFFLSLLTAPMFVRIKDLLFSNTAKKLKKEHPDVYQSVKSQVEYFKKLREKIL